MSLELTWREKWHFRESLQLSASEVMKGSKFDFSHGNIRPRLRKTTPSRRSSSDGYQVPMRKWEILMKMWAVPMGRAIDLTRKLTLLRRSQDGYWLLTTRNSHERREIDTSEKVLINMVISHGKVGNSHEKLTWREKWHFLEGPQLPAHLKVK